MKPDTTRPASPPGHHILNGIIGGRAGRRGGWFEPQTYKAGAGGLHLNPDKDCHWFARQIWSTFCPIGKGAGLGMRSLIKGMSALVLAGALVLPVSLSAQSATIAEMRQRDRLAPPDGELAAWESFAAPILANPNDGDDLRAEVLLGRAIARYYARDYEAAWRDIAEVGELLGDGNSHLRREQLAYGSLILTDLGRLEEAGELGTSGVNMARQAGEVAALDLALAHNALGYLAFAQNDLAAAESAFCQAADLGFGAENARPSMVVSDASSCGAVKYYLERSDTIPAIRRARDYAVANLPQDHPRMGNVLNTSYAVLMQYGRYAEALPLIRRHLELERQLRGEDDPYVYDALSMLARALEFLGQLEESEAVFAAAADLALRMERNNRLYTAGISRTNLARVIARQGRLQEAADVARQGVLQLEADLEPDDLHIGSGQAQLADHLSRLGQHDEALELVVSGIALLEAGYPDGHSDLFSARLIHARILSQLGQHDQAMPLASEAAEAITGGLFDLAASETELVSLSQVLPMFLGDYLQVALAAGDMEAGLRVAQLRLVSELTLSNARIRAGTLARQQGLGDVLDRLEAAQAEVTRLEVELARSQAGGVQSEDTLVDSAAIIVSLADARQAVEQAQQELQSEYPEYLAFARPDPASLAALQSALSDDELLVLPMTLRDRAITILVARDDVQWAQTPVTGFAVEQLASRLRASAEVSGYFDNAAAAQLYDVLFAEELRPLLASKSQLLFPSSGYLARISPAMLLTAAHEGEDLSDAPWLLRSHAVEVLADLTEIPSRRTASGAAGFLGVGAPSAVTANLGGEDGLDLPPLPRALDELEALANALGSSDQLILARENATEPKLTASDLPSYGVIACATHGLLGGEVPGLSEPALLLTPDEAASGSAADGLLTASEIATLSLNADWVILSACETAAGASAGAPGYSGLARAFVQAGARSLMLSHWRVRDDAAAFLSVETVRRSGRGEGRAQALRQAQLALMGNADIPDAAHPAIWAPFMMLQN